MKKLLIPWLAILIFTSCQKQISKENELKETAGATANKQGKVRICHKSKTIEVSQNALAAHLAHGDTQGDCSAAFLTTTICDQTWMVRNLDADHYRNGDPIPQVTDPAEWAALTTGAWCYYFNDLANGPIYGKLYNWYAVNDPRGLAPGGWHIPTIDEWRTLMDCLGGEDIAGGKLKEIGTTHWLEPNTGATNETGFTALPGNLRQLTGEFSPLTNTPFLGVSARWWTATEMEIDLPDFPDVGPKFYGLNVAVFFFTSSFQHQFAEDKAMGFSVRCIKN